MPQQNIETQIDDLLRKEQEEETAKKTAAMVARQKTMAQIQAQYTPSGNRAPVNFFEPMTLGNAVRGAETKSFPQNTTKGQAAAAAITGAATIASPLLTLPPWLTMMLGGGLAGGAAGALDEPTRRERLEKSGRPYDQTMPGLDEPDRVSGGIHGAGIGAASGLAAGGITGAMLKMLGPMAGYVPPAGRWRARDLPTNWTKALRTWMQQTTNPNPVPRIQEPSVFADPENTIGPPVGRGQYMTGPGGSPPATPPTSASEMTRQATSPNTLRTGSIDGLPEGTSMAEDPMPGSTGQGRYWNAISDTVRRAGNQGGLNEPAPPQPGRAPYFSEAPGRERDLADLPSHWVKNAKTGKWEWTPTHGLVAEPQPDPPELNDVYNLVRQLMGGGGKYGGTGMPGKPGPTNFNK